jgi:nicotinate-nucleotide pyrophosphorylase (carboxylating)
MPRPPITDYLDEPTLAAQVAGALAEDLGAGDLTAALIPETTRLAATVICREQAIVCGRPFFDAVFKVLGQAQGGASGQQRGAASEGAASESGSSAALDSDSAVGSGPAAGSDSGSATAAGTEAVRIAWYVEDGARVTPDTVLCTLEGPARLLLSGERTALNFLQCLSGTATETAHWVAAIEGTGARILDTRKTLPGLRGAQKYAVACGGGHNHRVGLFDAVLIKENHIAAAGSIAAAMQGVAAATSGREVKFVEVEVESLTELEQALTAGARRILLDNFTPEMLTQAVAQAAGRAELEASGNLSIENARMIAGTGVDYLSVGALTKHVRAVDLSMRFVEREAD